MSSGSCSRSRAAAAVDSLIEAWRTADTDDRIVIERELAGPRPPIDWRKRFHQGATFKPMLADLERMLLMEVIIHHVDALRFLLGPLTLVGAQLGKNLHRDSG